MVVSLDSLVGVSEKIGVLLRVSSVASFVLSSPTSGLPPEGLWSMSFVSWAVSKGNTCDNGDIKEVSPSEHLELSAILASVSRD